MREKINKKGCPLGQIPLIPELTVAMVRTGLVFALLAGRALAVWIGAGTMECGDTNENAALEPDEFLLVYLSKGASVNFDVTSAGDDACTQVC